MSPHDIRKMKRRIYLVSFIAVLSLAMAMQAERAATAYIDAQLASMNWPD